MSRIISKRRILYLLRTISLFALIWALLPAASISAAPTGTPELPPDAQSTAGPKPPPGVSVQGAGV